MIRGDARRWLGTATHVSTQQAHTLASMLNNDNCCSTYTPAPAAQNFNVPQSQAIQNASTVVGHGLGDLKYSLRKSCCGGRGGSHECHLVLLF